jgi:hypothetical protein
MSCLRDEANRLALYRATSAKPPRFLKGSVKKRVISKGQNVAVEYHWLNGQYDQLPITYG